MSLMEFIISLIYKKKQLVLENSCYKRYNIGYKYINIFLKYEQHCKQYKGY